MPRPTMLTRDRRDKIVGYIATGAYAVVAARASGIGESTYHQWMKRGKEAPRNDDGTPTNDTDAPYVEFAEAVKDAEAKAEVLAIGRIQTAAQSGTWQAAAWYLERKYSDRWGRRDHIRSEISGPEGGPVEVDAEAALVAFLDGRRAALDEADEQEGGKADG